MKTRLSLVWRYISLLTFVLISSIKCGAQLNILTENFNATTFPPTASGTWTRAHVSGGSSTDLWKRATAGTGAVNASWASAANPGPHAGSGMAWFNCFNYNTGSTSDLATPAMSFTSASSGTYKVSFWMYRGDGLDWLIGATLDRLDVYVNTSATATGGTLLGTVYQDITQAPGVSAEGWYKYTFTVPASFSSATNYIVFRAVSDFWDDILIDDVSVDYYCSLSTTASNSGPVCPNTPLTLTGSTIGTTYSWTGPGGYSSASLSPTIASPVAGTYTFTASSATCTNTVTTTVSILPAPPVPVVTPSVATICNGSNVTLTATVPAGLSTILSQDFNTSIAPWVVDNTGMVSTSAVAPWQLRPDGYVYSGTLTYTFNSPDMSQFAIAIADATAASNVVTSLISPTFSLAGYSSATLTFQHAYLPYSTEQVKVQISTNGGATWTTLNDYAGTAVGSSTSFSTATFSLAPYLGSANCKLKYYYNSAWGWWWALDNILVTGMLTTPPMPVWTPVTHAYSDPGFATAYAGTATNNIYIHPTTVGSSTTVNYIASLTNGVCTTSDTAIVTINPGVTISGVAPLCPDGASLTLTGTPGGGTWSGGAVAVATVNSGGVVTSAAAGTTIVTYTASTGGCTDTALITVISAPSPITGSTSVCVGGVTTLGETTSGGSWSSSLLSRATVDAASGAVYGVSAGTVTMTYMMPSGCYVTYNMTVGSAPAPIVGSSAVCVGQQVSLSHPVSTGTWSIAPLATATITTGGVVGGASAGTANVTYTLSPGCTAFANITVNPLPDPISGPSAVCAGGSTIALTDATTPGSWSTSGSSAIATVNSSTGVVTGVGAGSVTVTYTASTTGCGITTPITVNALPLPITGATTTVCSNGATINLSDVSGPGTWSSGDMAIATVGTTSGTVYGVSAGVVPITFTNTATTCFVSVNVNVIPVPAAIGGTPAVCASGGITTLTDATTPGTWSVSSGGFASISSGGVVTGNTAGTATVTYTGANSCYITLPIVINPLPSAITGTFEVCQLAVTTLSSAPGTGTWSTANAAIATVVGGGGVRGVNPGTTTITYSLPTGCRATASVTVNEIPAAIAGSPSVCLNGITTLTNTVAGGTWSSSDLTFATVEATTGIVHGVAVGSANISYTTGTNGCYALFPINVTGLVVPTVSLNINPGTTICQDTLVTFTPTVTNGGASPLYVWSVNNVILAGTPTYSYHPHNGDLVRVWILSSYECAVPDTTSAWVTMTVNPIVTPGLTLATMAGGDTACAGALATILPVPVGGGSSPSYQWTINGVPSGVGSLYTYIPNNGDVITSTMTSNAPCRTANTASATKLLTVSPLITPLVSISSSLGYTLCDGYPDVLTTSMYGGGTAPTYQWTVNGSPMGTGPVYTYAPANGDVVAVTMTSNFPCVTTPTATTNVSLTVLPITQPVGVVTAQPGYIVPAGMNDTFTCTIVSGGGLAPTYQWYVNSIPQAGATNSVYITNNLHTGDSVNCEVVNTDQCSGVSVFSYIHITIGNNVGVHGLANAGSNVMLVPNPNSGSFHVKGNINGVVNGNIDVQVTDMLGKAVYMGKATVTNGVVDSELQLGDNLANGTYLLTIRNGEEQSTMHFTLQR